MGTVPSSPITHESFKDFKQLNEIRFFLQEKEHIVKTEEITARTTLNEYLRKTLSLTGTKAMCREGGCGACIVVLQSGNYFSAVNSCLVPLLSCNNSKVYTIEGIGGSLQGYHPVQKTLAEFNGTQCGFCTTGMIMNMYALYRSPGKLTMDNVENSFGGNICRCTGYRPILTAFKSLCEDSSWEVIGEVPDIEDCGTTTSCDKTLCPQEVPFYHSFSTYKWIKLYSLSTLLNILTVYSKLSYKLVAGATAQGVYRSFDDPVDLYIDVTSVAELISYQIKNEFLILGANTTLTQTIDLFNKTSQDYSGFQYLKQMAKHIDLIANVPVRNVGTIAGNLMIKYNHNEFPSDIFLILETVGALLLLVSKDGKSTFVSPQQFLSTNMKGQIIASVYLPQYGKDTKFVSYKIMPRAQNTHAIINAGFLFKLSPDKVENATITFGNINPTFMHATNLEFFLKGKNLFQNGTLLQAYTILDKQLQPDLIPPDPSPEFRRKLAISLFYKAVLSIAPDSAKTERNKSGGTVLERPISKGVQDFETNASLYPLTQAIPKLEALAQTSGEAEYIGDMPDLPNQLYGAFVLAKIAPNSKIIKIDASKALQHPTIVAFFDKNDIPGDNNFTPLGLALITVKEEIFCSGRVQYYHQPVGVLVGSNENEVLTAISLVDISFDASNLEPLLGIRQVLERKRNDRIIKNREIERTRKGTDVVKILSGTFDIHQQYHFHMEMQCCNVVPTEDGLNVYPSSQWMDIIQVAISNMLKIPNNKVNVFVKRCGGGFGAKISRNSLISCVAALASWKLKKPVKISLPLSVNMDVVGKRWPLSCDYEVAVNSEGIIQYLDCHHYIDVGAQINEDNSAELLSLFTRNYNSETFKIEIDNVITDTPVNTWARAPGSVEGLASIEAIMEHIAYETNLNPLSVRLSNLVKDSPLLKYVNDMKSWADIDGRKSEINGFNQANRWKKKGLAVVPMNYKLGFNGIHSVMVSIFHGDGSVQVAHSGVEIGQGINTKVAQVCAYKLGIELEKVAVCPSSSFNAANAVFTGGSVTSEAVCFSVIQACDVLLNRMAPTRKELGNPKWEILVEKCFQKFIDLSARGTFSNINSKVPSYPIYGICACEVELDVLTGQHIISRLDLIEDVGQSISPDIDIGQIEGAFVMGMGYYTTEKLVFNYEGRLLTNNTWTYHPPGAKDIPVQFNVKIPKNNPNPVGILNSKATGEPAVCLSVAVPLAIKNAVASARKDAHEKNPEWYPFDGPTTVEDVFMNSFNSYEQYIL